MDRGQNLPSNEAEKRIMLQRHQQALQLIRNAKETRERLASENDRLRSENSQLSEELRNLHQQMAQKQQEFDSVIHSNSWRMMAPFRAVKRGFYNLTEKTVFTHKARKAISILIHSGWKEFWATFKRFLYVRHNDGAPERAGIQVAPAPTESNAYDSEYQDNQDYSAFASDVKPLAFYLPQYHAFPENDAWWGKGFTEWVNVRSGKPGFPGHYQPRVPHDDIGYYCLDNVDVLRKQAELAKQHGIYGFCFYYYWFSGKRLMEKPVDMLLQHPEIDLPFCLCWANENWTRAWDGKNKDVLIGQEYSDQDDNRFISDMEKYIRDPRYIKIDGKPLVVVYNPGQIPNCHKTFATWRKTAKRIGLGEILIWTCETANNTAQALKIEDCIDATIEFPPHNMWMESIAVKGLELGGKSAFVYHYGKLVDYLVKTMAEETPRKVPVHHSCMMGWDNAARRKDGWFTYFAFSLKALYRWTLAIAERTRKDFKPEERFMFINAWNEWGEGTYLEPDQKYGYANINTISKAIFSLPFRDDLEIVNAGGTIPEDSDIVTSKEPRIAVQVHMFYTDVLDETIINLNRIPYPFDCYISTDTDQKKEYIARKMKAECKAVNTYVQVFDNRGRDVAPFLVQMHEVLKKYKYICHIHSKKTKTNDHGNEWRTFIFRHLFGCEENISKIISMFEADSRLGIIMPETYPVLELQAEWGGNRAGVEMLMSRMGYRPELPDDPTFPVGNMFWARSTAVQPLFDLDLKQTDFPKEAKQVNSTIAHQIERCWVYLARENGFGYRKVFNNIQKRVNVPKLRRLGIFVHYNADNALSADDCKTVATLSRFLDRLEVVSNSHLSVEDCKRLKSLGKNVSATQRDNVGMDFGAWRDALLSMGKDKITREYDEVVLCNNSFFPPVFPLETMFASMEDRQLDFWGNTIFPRLEDGSYIKKAYIPEHLQSYWLVFGGKALESEAFWNFWKDMPDYENYIDVVANCESQLTEILSNAHLTYEPYIRETYYISRFLNNFALPYEKPSSLLLLGDTFIKKKCYQYMNSEEKVKLEYLWGKLRNKVS